MGLSGGDGIVLVNIWQDGLMHWVKIYWVMQGSREERSGSSVECLTQDSRGCGFNPHRRHYFVSLSKTLYPLLSTGSTQEDPTQHD